MKIVIPKIVILDIFIKKKEKMSGIVIIFILFIGYLYTIARLNTILSMNNMPIMFYKKEGKI